jgi:hypothetical protein
VIVKTVKLKHIFYSKFKTNLKTLRHFLSQISMAKNFFNDAKYQIYCFQSNVFPLTRKGQVSLRSMFSANNGSCETSQVCKFSPTNSKERARKQAPAPRATEQSAYFVVRGQIAASAFNANLNVVCAIYHLSACTHLMPRCS